MNTQQFYSSYDPVALIGKSLLPFHFSQNSVPLSAARFVLSHGRWQEGSTFQPTLAWRSQS